MPKSRVFVTRKIDQDALNKLSEFGELTIWPEDRPPSHEVLVNQAANSEGMITLLSDPIDQEVISAGEGHLKVISQMAVGFDNIAIAEATRLGIPVGNTPGVLTEATADHTWALLMAAARRITEADDEVHLGIWRPWGPDVLCGVEVFGATLGIIGFGRIGQAVARRAQGFNMQVQYYSRTQIKASENGSIGKYVTFEQLLKSSDFITIHVNLTPETFHLIGQEQFKMMKPEAILINTSRGSLVDSDALRWAVKNHIISAAGLDVYEPEPILQDDPILKLTNLVITPHIASATKKTRKKMAMITVDNLIAGLTGQKLPYCVNPEVYALKSE
jgi:glyoxylate reductase